jgi:hypothetical protein
MNRRPSPPRRFGRAETFPRTVILAVLALSSFGLPGARAAVSYTQATVTRLENDVSYGRQQGGQSVTRPAEVRDVVKANSFLLSEQRSRAELQYPDGAIVRVGENTVFSFEAKSRALALSRGMFFFYVPKGQGGGIIKTPNIAAAITGTVGKVAIDLIVILEGSVRLIPSGRAVVAGQFARKNRDGSITIDWFDKGRAPRGIISDVGKRVGNELDRDVLELVKYRPRTVQTSSKKDEEKSEESKPAPVAKPAPQHDDAMAKTTGKDAARAAAQSAAQAAARSSAATAAARAAIPKPVSKPVVKPPPPKPKPHHMH